MQGRQGSAASATCGRGRKESGQSIDAQEHKHRAEEPSWPLCGGPRASMQGRQSRAASAPSSQGLEVPGERKKVARTRPRRRGARGERFAGAAGPLGGAPRGTQHTYILGRRLAGTLGQRCARRSAESAHRGRKVLGPVCGPTAPRRPLWRLAGCGRMLATQGRRPAASAGDAAPSREI